MAPGRAPMAFFDCSTGAFCTDPVDGANLRDVLESFRNVDSGWLGW